MRSTRGARVLRGSLASSIATFGALMSHVAAGGSVPGSLGIVVPGILSLFVCVLMAGRSLSWVRLSLAVAGSQFLFHVLFVMGSFSPGGSAGHAHHRAPAHAPVATGTDAAIMPALHGDAAMWFAHAVAAAITIVALHRGEHAARSLLRLISALGCRVRRIAALLTEPAAPPSRSAVAPAHSSAPARTGIFTRASLSRRGPPSFAAL